MKQKTKITFDELEINCLTEMPLLLDVISSTGNKITRIFEPFQKEMNEIIKTELKPNWEISKKSFDCLIFPLTDQEELKINITSFDTNLKIECATKLVKIEKGKEVNFFWAYFGYKCFNEEEESTNIFYFNVTKSNIKERFGGAINELKFYKDIKSKCKDYNIEISHPDIGDELEDIELQITEFSIEKITDGFETYRDNILTPFLQTMQ